MTDSPTITHQDCPECQAKGSTSYWEGGSWYCHSCEGKGKGETVEKEKRPTTYKKGITPKSLRGVHKTALEYYNVTQGWKDDKVCWFFPYDDEMFKTREKEEKVFDQVNGKGKQGALFGKPRFSSGGKYITVTEGEIDCLSLFQTFNCQYPVVSVSSASAIKKVMEYEDNFKWLDSFENIVLMFDDDDAGRKAARQFQGHFAPGKVKIGKMNGQGGFKDANAYVMAGRTEELKKVWWSAEIYKPSEIINGSTLINDVVDNPIPDCYDLPWSSLNSKTYGYRLGELWSIKAPPKVGKTSVLLEIAKKVKDTTSFSIGTFLLEESNKDSAMKFTSLYANQRLYLPDCTATKDERREAAEEALGDGRLWLYDDFGGLDFSDVVSHIRFYVNALGCRVIILDHISMLANAQDGDERKVIDDMAHQLKKLTIELNCTIFVVSHVNDEGKFRGSRALQQLSNMVIALERDKTNSDPDKRNELKIMVEESRFNGDTGPTTPLTFSPDTGRLTEFQEELV